MHIYAVLPFALLLWWPDQRPFPGLLMAETLPMTLSVVIGQIALLGLSGAILFMMTGRRLKRDPQLHAQILALHHLGALVLRTAAVGMFAADLFLTRWPEWVRQVPGLEAVWAADELAILGPFFISVVVSWLALYATDARIRSVAVSRPDSSAGPSPAHWSLSSYLLFHLRHQLLVIAVPMTLILAVHDATRHEKGWVGYLALSGTAAVVFALAPLMLRHIWSTHRLPDGPLRRRLETLSRRIGLRFRDILVWRSDHMMVNAAVMGVTGRLRYVLLSDGLLDSMSDSQIEAVFGHEAGHIRYRHIPYFVLFAIVGTLIVSGLMEILLRLSDRGLVSLDIDQISVVGFTCMILVWGVGFGWISRRFEWQADVFGAQCVSPPVGQSCGRPCSVHREWTGASESDELSTLEQSPAPAEPFKSLGIPNVFNRPTSLNPPLVRGETTLAPLVIGETSVSENRLCISGAEIFAGALNRVAFLNGIPTSERSWRHSSIAYRMGRLVRLAGDPRLTQRFQKNVRRLKTALVAGSLIGLAIMILYVFSSPVYRAELNLPWVNGYDLGEAILR